MSPAVDGGARHALRMLPVRWSGLAMAGGMLAAGRPVDAAVAMLVALAQVCAWRLRIAPPWEIAISAAAMVAAVSSSLHLYERWPWWDIPVHAVLTAVLAVLAARLLRREDALTTAIAGLVLAVVWEVLEHWGHQHVDTTIYVAPGDTALDIIAGTLGAATAGVLRARSRVRAGRRTARADAPHRGPRSEA